MAPIDSILEGPVVSNFKPPGALPPISQKIARSNVMHALAEAPQTL